MSCGELHDEGIEGHLHAPHDHDAGPVDDAVLPDLDSPPPAPPSRTERAQAAAAAAGRRAASRVGAAGRGTWDQQGYLAKPFFWVLPIDGVTFIGHAAATGNPFHGVIAAFIEAAAAETATEVVNHRNKRSDVVRARMRRTIMAVTPWAAVAQAWTPMGPHHIVQWVGLAGGGTIAVIHAYRARQARRAIKPKAEIAAATAPEIAPPAAEDPRLAKFRARFCGPGHELAGTGVTWGGDSPAGFILHLFFPETPAAATRKRFSQETVGGLLIEIGQLYDLTREKVRVGYIPGRESETCCQVMVRDAPPVPAEHQGKEGAPNRWDGTSTYDPETGMVDVGPFEDVGTAHYRFHEPHSGALGGMIAGAPRRGKSTTISVLGVEAGLAKLCSRCGNHHTCKEGCDPQRVMAVWIGDAQGKGLGIWKGKADLTGWGPGGCLELLHLGATIHDNRIAQNDTLVWYDVNPVTGERRKNVGMPTFDPWVGYPLVFIALDELRKLLYHPEYGEIAKQYIIQGMVDWPKVGIHLLVGTHMLDVTFTGDRAVRELLTQFNLIAHGLDSTSSNMGNIEGDPALLPQSDRGAGYIAPVDGRPGTRFDTKRIRDYNPPGWTGVDLRYLVDQVASTPIAFDEAYNVALQAHGLVHQQVITEWGGADEPEQSPGDATIINLTSAPSAQKAATAASASPVPVSAVGIDGLPTSDEAGQVKTMLMGLPGGASTRDVMEETGWAMDKAKRALDWLVTNNQATCETTNDGRRYTAAA